jgi:endonuclease-3
MICCEELVLVHIFCEEAVLKIPQLCQPPGVGMAEFDFSQFAFQPASKRQRCANQPLSRRPSEPDKTESSANRAPAHAVEDGLHPCFATRSNASTSLAEYDLICSYRGVTQASVDAFHGFLVALGTGGEPHLGDPTHGRFWALIACLLSVQCRDVVALEVTREIMRCCGGRGAEGVLALSADQLEGIVKRCNYCKTKAKNVRAAAVSVSTSGGRVPATYDGLLALEGVGPKIAHLMRSVAYGETAGIVVDTHVLRVSSRLGWVDSQAAARGPEEVRQRLEEWVPVGERTAFSLAVVGFGQLARSGAGWGHAFVQHAERLARDREHAQLPNQAQQSAVFKRGDDGPVLASEEATKGEALRLDSVALANSIVRKMDGEAGGAKTPLA